MSQIDTGLGWSANSEYLIQAAGQFANCRSFGGSEFPGQPIPRDCASGADVILGGFIAYSVPGNNEAYYFGVTGNADVVMFAAGEPEAVYLVSPVSGVQVIRVRYNYQTQTIRETTTLSLNSYDSTHGYYYFGQQMYYSFWSPVVNIPWFSTPDDGVNAIQVIDDYVYKLNLGYAVSCVAKWITPDGSTIQSPVLISNAALTTAMSKDGTTPASNMSTFDFLRDGMRFYMTILTGIDEYAAITSIMPIVDLSQFAAAAPSKVFSLLASNSYANILVASAPDPYEEGGGASNEEGGDGDTDPEDDPVEEETLPLPAVVGLGFATIYVPTQADLYNLAAYMWGGNLDLDNFLKLFANPMDSILGLSAVPVVLSGTYEPIYLGGQQLQGVTMPRYTGRTSVKVDMGTTTIKERWGAYLDYDPYTELAIYVPFIGIKNIKADDVMGKTIRLMYNIDILSGACVAYLRTEGGSVLYEWSGQCAVQLPITGANWDNIFSTAVSTAATLGGALFAPASAPVLGGAVASAAVQAVAAKPRIERSGAMNGITGFLGQLRPYILRTTPEAYIPGDQNKFIGYPSYMSVNLGELTGYNEIASIHLENIPATGDELAELESILKGGVIF